jgi:outer membrane lipoprotein-sorting protein
MKKATKAAMLLALVALVAGAVAAQSHAPVKSAPGFELLKSFAGTWKGTTTEGPGEVTGIFRVISDGSAVMLQQQPDNVTENMVTIFYPDSGELMGTHYCAAHNQPQMKLTSAEKNKLTFETVYVTNLANADEGHMRRLVITVVDPDHQIEEWTYIEKGQETTGRFDMHRVK